VQPEVSCFQILRTWVENAFVRWVWSKDTNQGGVHSFIFSFNLLFDKFGECVPDFCDLLHTLIEYPVVQLNLYLGLFFLVNHHLIFSDSLRNEIDQLVFGNRSVG
jgi:hypothetical protein